MTIEPNLIALGISRQSCEVKRSTTMGRSAAWAVTGDRPANNPSDKTRRENMVILAGVTTSQGDVPFYTRPPSHLRKFPGGCPAPSHAIGGESGMNAKRE